jgi:3-deoxy-D-manno-octulosonate 8-phosphate phosphatase (KDO 8-P phosphatase)
MSVAAIRLVLLDVDGVLTDGSIYIGANGEEYKKFHVRDGLGMVMLQRHGIAVGIISGRASSAVAHRMQELKITLVYQDVHDKLACYEKILRERGLTDRDVAYMGDDLPDLPVLRRVGLAAAPADAVPEVREAASFVAPLPGGCGAVRALSDFILKAFV